MFSSSVRQLLFSLVLVFCLPPQFVEATDLVEGSSSNLSNTTKSSKAPWDGAEGVERGNKGAFEWGIAAPVIFGILLVSAILIMVVERYLAANKTPTEAAVEENPDHEDV